MRKKLAAFTAIISGMIFQALSKTLRIFKKRLPSIWFFSTIWFLTPSSTQFLLNLYFPLAKNLLKFIDLGWLEFWGPQNIFKTLSTSSNWISVLQNNVINKIILLSCLFFLILIISVSIYSILNTSIFHVENFY